MKLDELKAIVEEMDKECTELLGLKNADYSNEEDALDNFKKTSAICAILDIDTRRDGQDSALFLAILKLTRWCNLRNKTTKPVNEPIRGSVADLHNYINLGYALSVESKETL